MKYANLTITGLARKRTLWLAKHSEAATKVGRASTPAFKAMWEQKLIEAVAELEAIRDMQQLRRLSS